MKRKLQLIGLLFATNFGFAQFTTGEVVLNGTFTAKIDTDASGVTLTLKGSSTSWLGIGFGGTAMSSATDMFIWNSSTNRDYTSSGSYSVPSADTALNQSWAITSDNVVSGIRTVVATRALSSAGDYTFANNNTSIPIIFGRNSSSTTLVDGHDARGGRTLTRTTLGLEDFSLNATSIYPNPASGAFYIKTKTNLSKVNLYNQTGALVRTIKVTDYSKEVELSVSNVQAGVYFLELQNDSEKSWKKVIVN
jgi:hypothetical protein